jgi:hypothetical protein
MVSFAMPASFYYLPIIVPVSATDVRAGTATSTGVGVVAWLLGASAGKAGLTRAGRRARASLAATATRINGNVWRVRNLSVTHSEIEIKLIDVGNRSRDRLSDFDLHGFHPFGYCQTVIAKAMFAGTIHQAV